jgi:hypothetical protein
MPALAQHAGSTPPGYHGTPCAPLLPPLSGIPAEIVVLGDQNRLVDLAQTMVRAGVARPCDRDPYNPAPGRIIERSMERTIREIGHGLSDTMPIFAIVRPWGEVLAGLFGSDFSNEQRWLLALESEETHRIRVGPLVEALGEDATALVLCRLMRHTPLCTEGPDELAWIIDGWREGAYEDRSEAKAISARVKSAAKLTKRIDRLLTRGHDVPLDELPPARLRRLFTILEKLSRTQPQSADTAWVETREVEWGLPRPVIQLIWDRGCALDHALDEAEFLLNQDGSCRSPQQMWILDPADTTDSIHTWTRWIHALREVRIVSRILHALDELADTCTLPCTT